MAKKIGILVEFNYEDLEVTTVPNYGYHDLIC